MLRVAYTHAHTCQARRPWWLLCDMQADFQMLPCLSPVQLFLLPHPQTESSWVPRRVVQAPQAKLARWRNEDHQRYQLLYFSLNFLGAKHVMKPSEMSEMCVRIYFEYFDAKIKAIPRKKFISARNV